MKVKNGLGEEAAAVVEFNTALYGTHKTKIGKGLTAPEIRIFRFIWFFSQLKRYLLESLRNSPTWG